jgi:hypothetical protein
MEFIYKPKNLKTKVNNQKIITNLLKVDSKFE